MKTLETDLRVHSRNQLELKTSIPIKKLGIEKHILQIYIFSPKQLNIRSNSNDQSLSFYSDISVRTRFSSPTLSLDSIINPNCELSPLCRILHQFEKSILDREVEHVIIYELQILVNNFRREMKDTSTLVSNEAEKPSAKKVCSNKINKMLKEVDTFIAKYRDLYDYFLEPRVPGNLREAFLWCDETLSAILIETFVELFILAKNIPLSDTLVKKIEEAALEEEAHRKEYQFVSDFETASEHTSEAVSYRSSMLKKWSQSALYIKTEESRLPKQVGHIFAGAAAATAMTFAVLASLYAQRVFSQNTLPWALIIILAYVFKDRIKEVTREVLGRGIPKLIADNITRYQDPITNERVGNAKERIDFLRLKDVPRTIRDMRYKIPNPFRNLMPEEDIIFYSREITANSRKLKQSHSRLEAINEIIRIRLDKWFKEMDDQEDLFHSIVDGKVIVFEGKKVYHLHLVVGLGEKKDRGNNELFHYEIVVSKTGVQRIIIL